MPIRYQEVGGLFRILVITLQLVLSINKTMQTEWPSSFVITANALSWLNMELDSFPKGGPLPVALCSSRRRRFALRSVPAARTSPHFDADSRQAAPAPLLGPPAAPPRTPLLLALARSSLPGPLAHAARGAQLYSCMYII